MDRAGRSLAPNLTSMLCVGIIYDTCFVYVYVCVRVCICVCVCVLQTLIFHGLAIMCKGLDMHTVICVITQCILYIMPLCLVKVPGVWHHTLMFSMLHAFRHSDWAIMSAWGLFWSLTQFYLFSHVKFPCRQLQEAWVLGWSLLLHTMSKYSWYCLKVQSGTITITESYDDISISRIRDPLNSYDFSAPSPAHLYCCRWASQIHEYYLFS